MNDNKKIFLILFAFETKENSNFSDKVYERKIIYQINGNIWEVLGKSG